MAESFNHLDNEQVTLVEKSWTLLSDESVKLLASGDRLQIAGLGKNTSVFIDSNLTTSITVGEAYVTVATDPLTNIGGISLTAGPEGNISMWAGVSGMGTYVYLGPEWAKIQVGPNDIGAQIAMTPETILLSVGPSVGGASVRIQAEKITIQVGETSYEISPMSIAETLAVVTRKLTAEGHSLDAAETNLTIGVQGYSGQFPTHSSRTEATRTRSQLLLEDSSEAVSKTSNAIQQID